MKAPLALLFFSLLEGSLGAINWDVFEFGVVDSFRWARPFPDDGTDPVNFHVHCKTEATFHAKMYKLSDLPDDPPTGLSPWHGAIEDFLGKRDYAGSWDGVDHKEQEREIVVMEYTDVPEPVRQWIEEQQQNQSEKTHRHSLFAVFEKPKKEGDKIHSTVSPRSTAPAGDQETEKVAVIPDKDKIVVFPAGSAYEILPLWVSKGSKCERALSNLDKYKPEAHDDAILAWVVDHTKPQRDLGKRDITFKVEAMSVTETDDGKKSRLLWEKMHRAIKRNERKIQKEDRLKVRKEMESGRMKDEL